MEHNCGVYISKIKQLNGRVLNKILKNRGIDSYNAEQGKILYELFKEDNQSNKEISYKTGLALNTLTSMLSRIEEQGLINKKTDNIDKRKIIISLTEKGKSLKDEFYSVIDELVKNVFIGFSEEEISIFEKYLEKVMINYENFEKTLKDKK